MRKDQIQLQIIFYQLLCMHRSLFPRECLYLTLIIKDKDFRLINTRFDLHALINNFSHFNLPPGESKAAASRERVFCIYIQKVN